jgi:hypothetical protein
MTFRFEEPTALDKHFAVVAKARVALAAAEVAGRKAQNALDKARLKFDRAAAILRSESQPIEYDFNDTLA